MKRIGLDDVLGASIGALAVLVVVAGILVYVHPREMAPIAAAPVVSRPAPPTWDFQREVTTLEQWCKGNGVSFHGHKVTILCNDKVNVEETKADLAALNRTPQP
jgi:hypothetical protein